MEYHGKLYGYLGRQRRSGKQMYFDTGKTTADYDALEKRVVELENANKDLARELVIKSSAKTVGRNCPFCGEPCVECSHKSKEYHSPIT